MGWHRKGERHRTAHPHCRALRGHMARHLESKRQAAYRVHDKPRRGHMTRRDEGARGAPGKHGRAPGGRVVGRWERVEQSLERDFTPFFFKCQE